MNNSEHYPHILLTCQGSSARAQVTGTLTTGLRGVRVQVALDAAWEGLNPSLIASCGGKAIRLALTDGGASLPSECCQGGQRLKLGVDGWNGDGRLRIPTIWADCGMVLHSVAEGNVSEGEEEPAPGWQEQIYDLAHEAEQMVRELMQRADSGEFAGKSPQIGTDGCWYIWDGSQWINTGVDATGQHLGFRLGSTLKVMDGALEVNATDSVAQANPLPITSAGVHEAVEQVRQNTYTKEQADQKIRDAVPADYGQIRQNVAALQADLASQQKINARQERDILNLKAVAEGNLYRMESDTQEAYSKQIPADALPGATLDSIGGHSEVIDGAIVSADVDNIELADSEGSVMAQKPIPSEIRTLPGYGWSAGSAYNEVDFENRRYIQRVDAVNLGTLTYSNGSTSSLAETTRYVSNGITAIVKPGVNNQIASIICDNFEPIAAERTYNGSIGIAIDSSKRICIYDGTANPAAFKLRMSGVMLYYELAEPIVTDISDLIPDGFAELEVEPGGSITFRQSSLELPVPNQETYIIKLGGATA